MHVYCIYFEDGSNYIGATKNTIENRINNHLYKFRSNKYNHRRIYQKMKQFNEVFKYKILGSYKSSEEMYEKEIGYIALFSGSLNLNNSTGGKISSLGKTVSAETIQKFKKTIEKKSHYFEVFCKDSKKLLYSGKSMHEASVSLNVTHACISFNLKNAKNNIANNRKRKNNGKFIFVIPGVGYSDHI